MENAFELIVGGNATSVILNDNGFTVKSNNIENNTIRIDDIVALERTSSVDVTGQSGKCAIHYIQRHEKSLWTKEILAITSEQHNVLQTFYENLQKSFDKIVATRPKRLLILLNPVGGKGQAQKLYDTVMTPVFELAKISCDLVVSQRPKHLIEVMADYDCKDVDGIVILGGDGTFSEVINELIKKTQDEAGIDYNDPNAELKPLSKPVCVVPTGTGNGLAESLVGCKDVLTTTLHIVRGKTKSTNILGSYCENNLIGYSGCIFGTQMYAESLQPSSDQEKRWGMAVRALVSLFQFIFTPIRTVEVEITVYSTEKYITQDGGKEREEIKQKEEIFKQETCASLISPRALINKEGKFCVNADDRREDELFAIIYSPMGKIAWIKHIYEMVSRKDNILNNPNLKLVAGYALRIKFLGKEDDPTETHPGNLKANVDGELMYSPKADYYIKLISGLVTVYSSSSKVPV